MSHYFFPRFPEILTSNRTSLDKQLPNPSQTPCIAAAASPNFVHLLHDTTNKEQRETRNFLTQSLRWTVGEWFSRQKHLFINFKI